MKIIFEASDGDAIPSLLHDRYCYAIQVFVEPDKMPKIVVRDAWRGAARMIDPTEAKIEYPGAEPAQVEPVAVEEKPKAKRARASKQKDEKAEAEPALAGPRLQNTDDLFD